MWQPRGRYLLAEELDGRDALKPRVREYSTVAVGARPEAVLRVAYEEILEEGALGEPDVRVLGKHDGVVPVHGGTRAPFSLNARGEYTRPSKGSAKRHIQDPAHEVLDALLRLAERSDADEELVADTAERPPVGGLAARPAE